MSPLLELKTVSKSYVAYDGKRQRVLDQISFSLFRGEILGLTGPSGAGKSTLAKIILGIESHDAGRVAFQGRSLSGPIGTVGRAHFSRVQMIWQDPVVYLNPYLSAIDLVMEPMQAFKKSTRRQCRERALNLMAEAGLDCSLAGRKPAELSGGQCQRVAIARALSISPKLLICDEALVSLDLIHQVSIIKLLKRLRNEIGLSILFITHDRAGVHLICDRELCLHHGGNGIEVREPIKLVLPGDLNQSANLIKNSIGCAGGRK